MQLLNGEYLEMFGAGTSSGRLRGHPSIPGVELATTTADPLMFSTNNAERVRIAANGYVGIGINNPAAPLEMYFPAATSYSPTSTQGARIRLINSAITPNNVFEIDLGSFDTNGIPSSVARLASIMTNQTPGATSGDFAIGLRSAGAIFEIARFSSNGRVGLGTTAPQDAFHVFNTAANVGTMRLQGGNTYAGFFGMWDGGQSLLLSNNRHPGTGANYNTAVAGAQLSLWGGDTIFYLTSSGATGVTTELMRIKAGGQVGIGTNNPAFKLDVQGGALNASGGICINGDCRTAWSQVGGGGSSQWTTSGTSIFYNSGNVGVGTTTPSVKLHVAGDGRFTGSLTVDGNLAAKYQDLAEWVPATEQFSAGTVVVLDDTTPNQVTSSNTSYDTRVAGVVSEQPGIALGEKSDTKVLVATTGRVRVKVDASKAPIRIGDLLVTSDVRGTAMKSEPILISGRRMHAPGTLVGKALEPLEKGTGIILVLLSLQ